MATSGDLRATLIDIAKRSVAIKSSCSNEESTKHFLILPVIGALGYDYTDPFVVQPEFTADFRSDMRDRVDYVVLRDGNPIIAIECKKAGSDLTTNRGQLRAYFTALPSVRLGILTNGTQFEFFVDCETPNIMDAEPFLTLDLESASRAPIPLDVIEGLSLLTHSNFHPEIIGEAAEQRLIARRLRSVLMEELREPSDEFCKVILQRAGLRYVRRTSIQTRYSSLIRTAFEEALIMPVLEVLRSSTRRSQTTEVQEDEAKQRIITTDRELAVYRYVCRRLAFLSTDEHQFTAVERVYHHDYIGKFVVYYEKRVKGRLFDFIEGREGYDKFIFPEPFGEIITNSMRDIDEPLQATFTRRLRELGGPKISDTKSLQRA